MHWQEASFASSRLIHGPMTASVANQWISTFNWSADFRDWKRCGKRSVTWPRLQAGRTLQSHCSGSPLGDWKNVTESDARGGRTITNGTGTSGHRSAIEPHDQNAWRQAIDVLIDAARDCLEWLAGNDSCTAERWCEELVASNVPLLRRLAVHAVSKRLDLTADERIDWVLKNTGLHNHPAHHEIFRTVGLAYPNAGSACRAELIESVQAYRSISDNAVYNERITMRWIEWLCKADPDCRFAKSALHKLKADNLGLEPEEHPDFLYWIGSVSHEPQTPWDVEELLGKPAADWLQDLLSFQPDGFRIHDRRGLVGMVQQAAARDFDWGLALADALTGEKQWDVDLWSGLILAWSNIELDENGYRRVLEHVAHVELYLQHAREVTAILKAVVKDRAAQTTYRLLPSANAVATRLWTHLDRDEPTPETG